MLEMVAQVWMGNCVKVGNGLQTTVKLCVRFETGDAFEGLGILCIKVYCKCFELCAP